MANNADRKSGHVLLAEDRLWAIDNGLCFHAEPKLRTVIWDFAGEPLDDDVVAAVKELADGACRTTWPAARPRRGRRARPGGRRLLAAEGRLPEPDAERDWPPYPWPLV